MAQAPFSGDSMNAPTAERTERLQLLKHRAQEMLQEHQHIDQPEQLASMEVTKLLEDLRIYQVELELQNEELRAAQQESDLSKRRYQTLFDQMPLAALVVDGQGIIENCNARAFSLLGPANRFGIPDNRLFQRLSGDDRSRLHIALRDGQHGDPLVLPGMGLANDNAAPWMLDFHLIQLSMDYHLNNHTLVLLVDRSAEVEREKNHRFFSLLLDSSDNFIYATDNQGKMLLANQSMLTFLGRPREEVLGQRRESFLPLRDAVMHNEVDQKVTHHAEAMTLEEQIHMGGTKGTLEFLTRKFPLHDADGRIYGVGAISTDITDIKARQRQNVLSESVFITAAEAIIITDTDTRIIRVNPAFTQQSGFSEASVVGHRTSMLKSGRQNTAFYQAMWEMLVTHGHWSGEICNRTSNGHFYTIWSNINAVRDESGKVIHYIAVQTDLTSLREVEAKVQHMASYDSLTGLPNRSLFTDRINQLMAITLRQKTAFALLFIDLDHFKEVNDTLGHQVGDQLLITIGNRLREAVRTEDTVARMGGDEFVVLLPAIDRDKAELVANNLLEMLRAPMTLDGAVQYQPMASVGLAMFPEDGNTPDLLLRNADIAMYEAKLSGRNRSASYTQRMSEDKASVFAIQTELATALAQQELRVYFQPKFHLGSGALVGAEALVRWERPGHGLVAPLEFIPIAEKSGQLVAIDRWVLDNALQQVAQWTRQGLWKSSWRVAVNQNAADLKRPHLVAELQGMLAQHGLNATVLELEITEDALLENTQEIIGLLGELTAQGITLAIDDFGTGYSSLSYLRRLPTGVIKIDQSFVRDMLVNESAHSLIETIITMAHNLGHELVAEGIEDQAQCDRLAELGCEKGQGYLFGRAVPAEEFMRMHLTAV
jgi:diguanylate cyclase (GGDEF)-like protein/PAS domain S-box-containing protein